MPGWGWLRLTLLPWLLCERATAPEVVLLLRTLLPPRTGWPALWRGCVPLTLPVEPVEPVAGSRCWRTAVPRLAVPELLPEGGTVWRVTLPELVLLLVLEPPRETWPLEPVLGRAWPALRL